MELPSIHRKLVVRVALAVLPLEFIAILGLCTIPFDVGYPEGASRWWIAFGKAGLCVHYPALALMLAYPAGPDQLSLSLVFVMIGYGDLFILGLVLALVYRFARKRISSMSWL
ncbi:MAG: hypothetical protein U0Q18_16090 [Bryobacteraceae bacterium]